MSAIPSDHGVRQCTKLGVLSQKIVIGLTSFLIDATYWKGGAMHDIFAMPKFFM